MMISLLVGLVIGSPAADSYVFEGTTSPSKHWGIGHATDAKGGDVNQLVDLRSKRVVARLRGFDGFKGENHGGMYAVYSKAEDVVAVMHDGKWEPRQLALVATSTGVQLDLLRKLQGDAKSHYRGKPEPFVYEVTGARFEGRKISFSMLGEVPKSEDAPVVYLAVSYAVTLTKGKLGISKPAYKDLTEATSWNWEGN